MAKTKSRGNGEGSVFQLPNGRYRVQWYVGGKAKTKSFTTSREANKYLREIKTSMDKGTYVNPSALTLGQWMETWLQTYNKHNVELSTYETNKRNVLNHIIPTLGKIPLQSLKTDQIQTFNNDLIDQKKLAPATVNRILAPLKTALRQAVLDQRIVQNPALNIKKPKKAQKEIHFLASDQCTALLDALPDSTEGNALRFILGTGLRVSELCALRWCDVAEDAIRITGSLYRPSKEAGMPYIRKSPKSNDSMRTIPLNGKLKALLHTVAMDQKRERLLIGQGWKAPKAETFVFTTLTGLPLDRHNINRTLRNACRKVGIEPCGVHTLRHTFATQWNQTMGDVCTLSKVIGHADAGFTMKTYVHTDDSIKKQGMSTMEMLL